MHTLTFTLLILTTAEISSTNTLNNASNSTTAQSNIIGIGGIIATLIAAAITCFVTWILTMKNMNQLKLAYRYQIFPILSTSVAQNTKINLTDWQIKYRNKLLTNPCLLTIDILNMGNTSIIHPPIKIETNNNINIIPGYFEETPIGYENLWKFEETDSINSYALSLDHINPRQIVKARFFLDNFPENKISFECPMPNIHIQEISSSLDSRSTSKNILNLNKTVNIIFAMLTTILLFNYRTLYFYLEDIIYYFGLKKYLHPRQILFYFIAVFLLTIIINIKEIKTLDNYLFKYPHKIIYIQLWLAITYIILLALIIPNIISGHDLQFFIAAFTAILLSILIRISIFKKENFT